MTDEVCAIEPCPFELMEELLAWDPFLADRILDWELGVADEVPGLVKGLLGLIKRQRTPRRPLQPAAAPAYLNRMLQVLFKEHDLDQLDLGDRENRLRVEALFYEAAGIDPIRRGARRTPALADIEAQFEVCVKRWFAPKPADVARERQAEAAAEQGQTPATTNTAETVSEAVGESEPEPKREPEAEAGSQAPVVAPAWSAASVERKTTVIQRLARQLKAVGCRVCVRVRGVRAAIRGKPGRPCVGWVGQAVRVAGRGLIARGLGGETSTCVAADRPVGRGPPAWG